jgi:hypothetical protein
MSALVQRDPPPDDDDGFGGSPNTTRLGGGNFLKWTKEAGWRDRDGIEAPSPMLVLAVGELLVRWQGNKPEYIREKPLPDPKVLNEAIPKSQWEKGIDGKLREHWAHNVAEDWRPLQMERTDDRSAHRDRGSHGGRRHYACPSWREGNAARYPRCPSDEDELRDV